MRAVHIMLHLIKASFTTSRSLLLRRIRPPSLFGSCFSLVAYLVIGFPCCILCTAIDHSRPGHTGLSPDMDFEFDPYAEQPHGGKPASGTLRCRQCHPQDTFSVELDKMRISFSLPKPRCFREIEVTCEPHQDVCVSKLTESDNEGWWLAKGCDQRVKYETVGCHRGASTHFQTSRAGGFNKVATAARRTVVQEEKEITICVCETSGCNHATSIIPLGNQWRTVSVTILVALVTTCRLVR